jgi:hypothetical protein
MTADYPPKRRRILTRKTRERQGKRQPSTFDRARDELFSAIRQCGVMDALEDEQGAWMDETLSFMAERHPELTGPELNQLKLTGVRFCQPVIPHGKEHTAISLADANAA